MSIPCPIAADMRQPPSVLCRVREISGLRRREIERRGARRVNLSNLLSYCRIDVKRGPLVPDPHAATVLPHVPPVI
jgi:hypothetical protein